MSRQDFWQRTFARWLCWLMLVFMGVHPVTAVVALAMTVEDLMRLIGRT